MLSRILDYPVFDADMVELFNVENKVVYQPDVPALVLT